MALRSRTRCAVMAAAILAATLVPYASAKPMAAAALKAAFIYNFAKFTEWPPNHLSHSAPIVVCVVGDQQVADALASMTAGRDIRGHGLEVRQGVVNGPIEGCNVVYVSGLDEAQAKAFLEPLKIAAVLTVSDLETFAQLGGTANFFIEDGRMRFAVNVESAARSGLHLSSRLLSVAKVVK
jgi:hypothetical protein